METKQNETKQVEQKKGKPAKRKWKNPFTSNRFKRGGMSTLLSVVFIAIVVAVNVGVTVLTDRFPSLDIDMTAQGLNTLSDAWRRPTPTSPWSLWTRTPTPSSSATMPTTT